MVQPRRKQSREQIQRLVPIAGAVLAAMAGNQHAREGHMLELKPIAQVVRCGDAARRNPCRCGGEIALPQVDLRLERRDGAQVRDGVIVGASAWLGGVTRIEPGEGANGCQPIMSIVQIDPWRRLTRDDQGGAMHQAVLELTVDDAELLRDALLNTE